jgi:DNA-binding response OmpR family regulator
MKLGTYLTLPDSILNLINLNLTKPLDLEQIAARRRMHRSDRVVAIRLELRDVDCTDAVRLDRINVDDEAVLIAVGQSRILSLQRSEAGLLTSLFESSLATDDGAIPR